MHGGWAAMLSFDHPLELIFDGAFVHESLLSWIARNDSKPQRGGDQESWVLHAASEWTDTCLEDDPGDVPTRLLDAFWQATGATPRTPSYAASHRWRYAVPVAPLDTRCLFDLDLGIGACGDWCSGPRVEGAFLSGIAMAGGVLVHVEAVPQRPRL
jgi:predicted NAD/FAD-dependent oxidoreductase